MESDLDKDYLISIHLNQSPYKFMSQKRALKEIKLHCGISADYISKYDAPEELEQIENVSNKKSSKWNMDDMLAEMARYQNIQTISEEESIFSGSEEFYVEKWVNRKPYNRMDRGEAEALVRSKLRIRHRDRPNNDSCSLQSSSEL